jgi:hypothetical protein
MNQGSRLQKTASEQFNTDLNQPSALSLFVVSSFPQGRLVNSSKVRRAIDICSLDVSC